MRAFILRSALHLLALVALANPADAGLIVTKMDTSTPIMTLTIPAAGMNGESGYVGPNTISYDGSKPVLAYCTDLFRSINISDSYGVIPQPLSTLAGGDQVARLFTADAVLGGGTWVDKAALQLAIWDVVESSRRGISPFAPPGAATAPAMLNAGEFKMPGVVDITASGIDLQDVMARVRLLLAAAPTVAKADLAYYAPGDYGQGFVLAVPVPEPSSLLSASIAGLIGLGYAWRRRARSAV